MSHAQIIYKIVRAEVWEQACATGIFAGAQIDLKDGFIHFSSAEQVRETAALHFAGQDNLFLVAVDTGALGEDLKWEASRHGQKFPHLYSALTMAHVLWSRPITMAKDGSHILPEN